LRLKRERDSAYGQTIKDIARKEASMSHIGKGAGILWRGEYALQRHTPARERIDNKEDGGNICELWRMQRQEGTDSQKLRTKISF